MGNSRPVGRLNSNYRVVVSDFDLNLVGDQGDYDPKRTKVLQYTMNPFSSAQRKLTAELEQLREENRRLTKRLQIMEESRGFGVGDLSARVDTELQASAGKEVEGMVKLQEEENYDFAAVRFFRHHNKFSSSFYSFSVVIIILVTSH